ncbi:anti-anti-sigma regulatory factor (antagonist of anti-sigma factor) [Rheinheimera sp. A13L]|uniref:STAS domain-containing protein n=1 Tax=Rheinheimera sp. A13L TaxID=506534 RepID=UPI0002124935|nr:STAS domain-containing protein [Rheinheimera sp. A13L]EGM76429.1 anti-anti-sigma regulatory factor (antagonist of anti-sigma factor) [Rheinheimera sp. A13L]
MTTPQDQILFACVEHCCYFKLCGELRYTNATGMDDLVERLFSAKLQCKQVVVDLNEASFMDSTYIGLLASLARYCQQQDLPKPTLFCTVPAVNELLFSLCLDQAFDIVQQPTNQAVDMTSVQAQPYSDQQKGLMILHAHEALIALNEKNKTEFQSVVDVLKQQLA